MELQFESLVNKILNEVSSDDPGAVQDAQRAHAQYKQTHLGNPYRSSYGSSRSRERNAGLEREDKAENMKWLLYKRVNGQLTPVESKDKITGRTKQFSAWGHYKATELVRKLKEKSFNAGTEFVLLNQDGETYSQVLFGR